MTAVLAVLAVLLGLAAGAAVVVRRTVLVVAVEGGSMAPALRPGDRLVVRRVPPGDLRRGDVVVLTRPGACRPGDPRPDRPVRMVKRLAALPGDPAPPGLPPWTCPAGTVPGGHVVVLGDNAARSVDSRTFGPVPLASLLGVARRRLG